MKRHFNMNEKSDVPQDIDQQIEECKRQLMVLQTKKKQLKNPDSLTMTVDEAADMLGVGRNTAYTAVKTGQIPAIKIGSRWLVPIAAIEKLLKG